MGCKDQLSSSYSMKFKLTEDLGSEESTIKKRDKSKGNLPLIFPPNINKSHALKHRQVLMVLYGLTSQST